jgi:hypothetical protein
MVTALNPRRGPRFSQEDFLEQMHARLTELESKTDTPQSHKAVLLGLRQQLDSFRTNTIPSQ